MVKTAVVILNFNGEKFLREFLPVVLRYTGNAKIVVADNASTDLSIDVVKQKFPTVELILLSNNYGFCGGYNRALKQVEAEYYVLLNSDVEVTPGWLEPLVTLLDQNPQVAAVQPKILAYNDKSKFEYAGAAGGFIDSLGYPFCRGRVFDETEKDSGQYNDTREVFWATGACLVIRSKIYHELKGLDEDFFAHMEEIDLCWKIQRAGHKVFYCGTSAVYHVGAGTLSKSNPRKTYYNFRNGLSLVYKHWSTGNLIWKLPVRILLDYLAAFKFLLSGKGGDARAVVRAHYHFIKKFGKNRSKRNALKPFPFTTNNIYPGMIIWDHFIRKKNKIRVY
ncbi:MAG: glycosyltransferase family 2 protein [Cyclobacteriaceae bacterium]|nr:glycosyltransferase family 2 protein [Cyclobacteriaceae bacterium]